VGREIIGNGKKTKTDWKCFLKKMEYDMYPPHPDDEYTTLYRGIPREQFATMLTKKRQIRFEENTHIKCTYCDRILDTKIYVCIGCGAPVPN